MGSGSRTGQQRDGIKGVEGARRSIERHTAGQELARPTRDKIRPGTKPDPGQNQTRDKTRPAGEAKWKIETKGEGKENGHEG